MNFLSVNLGNTFITVLKSTGAPLVILLIIIFVIIDWSNRKKRKELAKLKDKRLKALKSLIDQDHFDDIMNNGIK